MVPRDDDVARIFMRNSWYAGDIDMFQNELDFQRGSTFVTRRIDPFACAFVCLMIRIEVIPTSKFVHESLVA